MAKLITVFWRDIPSQVMVRKGRQTLKAMLGERFQDAIDRAAMRAGKGSSDAYLSEWRRDTVPCGDENLDQIVRDAAERLEGMYADEDLLMLIRAHGCASPGAAQAD